MFDKRVNAITAALMTIVLIVSTLLLHDVISVYADDEDIVYEDTEDGAENIVYNADAELPPEESEPETNPEEGTSGGTDSKNGYSISCYTPKIEFGTVGEGDMPKSKQISVINTGYDDVNIMLDVIDPYNAFSLETTTANPVKSGKQAVYTVSPVKGLNEGMYTATYIFYNAGDSSREGSVRVTVSIKVGKKESKVDSVVISPGSADVAVGKSIQFKATLSGSEGLDESVTWSISGQSSSNTFIDANGKLNVASDEASTSIAVMATSRQTPSKYDNVIVSVSKNDHMVSVSASPAEGGNVTGGGSVRDGSGITLSQSANNNYRFIGWYEAGKQISTASQLVLNDIRNDVSIQAKYERNACKVRAGVNNSAAGTVTGAGNVAYNGSVTLTANANKGYTFEGFYEGKNKISDQPSVQINNITRDMDVTAYFRQSRFTVSVAAAPIEGGLIYGSGTFDENTKVTLEAKPNKGYDFIGWSINGQVVSKDTKYTIDKIKNNYSITANFALHTAKTYKITSGIANQGGGITPSGETKVAEGANMVYNIVPLSGYKVLAVAVDGAQVGAVSSYTFTNVKADHTITAAFVKVESTGTTQNKTASASDKKSASSTKAAVSYTDTTASRGALPEQVVVEEPVLVQEAQTEAVVYEEDVFEELEEAPVSGVLSRYGLTEEIARQYIRNGTDLPLLKAAFESGDLEITVNNSYADDVQETAVATYYENPTLHNFEEVVTTALTEEEKIAVLNGAKASFNVNITGNNEQVSSTVKKLMQKKVGYKPVEYFDLYIMKTTDASSVLLHNTDRELEMTIRVPEKLRKSGRDFYILREHNGEVDVLKDLDKYPDTITFRTNKFSEYAIAYEALNVNVLIIIVVAIMFVALIIASICFANLIRYKHHARRRK